MTSKTPSQPFFAHAGLSKTKNLNFPINQKCYLYISSFCHGQSLLPSILSSTLLMGRRGWFGRASGGFRKPPSILFLGRVEDAGSRRVSVSVIEKGGVFRPSRRRRSLPRCLFAPRAVASMEGAPKKGSKGGHFVRWIIIKNSMLICSSCARARALLFSKNSRIPRLRF